ncbi:hypothetical protein ACFWBX_23005 [Streptomyces sp. NPDC059991]|uniref:hypothetical protein n=1 Tax=Streptomyces sp. NPDC059991 TaxID=3347028 RepID=UPI00368A3714
MNFIPEVGDIAQRGVDALTYQWQLDEQARINHGIQEQNGKVFVDREGRLKPPAPLLPDGQKLKRSPKTLSAESSTCSVFVDKQQAVYATDDVTGVGTDPVAVRRGALARTGNPQKAAIGGDARIADKGGVAVSVCTYQGRRQNFVALVDLASEHVVPKPTADSAGGVPARPCAKGHGGDGLPEVTSAPTGSSRPS